MRTRNPALRHELSFEMGQVQSEPSLHFGFGLDSSEGSQRPEPVYKEEEKSYRTLARMIPQ